MLNFNQDQGRRFSISITLTLSDSAELGAGPMGRGDSSYFPSLDPVGFADLLKSSTESSGGRG
jgi:hypothetical protein